MNSIELVFEDVGVDENPHLLWNYDEKSQQFQHKPGKVIARKGKKCDAVTSDLRESFTVILMINALGKCLAPVIIVKGKTERSLKKWKIEDFPEAIWLYSEKGFYQRAM